MHSIQTMHDPSSSLLFNDYDRLIGWIDSAEILMQFAGPAFHFPLTHEQLSESLNDEKRLSFVVVEDSTNEAIGHAEIYKADNSAFFGRLLIGDEQRRGKGTGLSVVSALLRIAFDDLNYSLAELNVFDWNVAAIRCYQKAGFVLNPEKKAERRVNGQMWTAVNMRLPKSNSAGKNLISAKP